MKRSKHGFTLIEVLIAVVIVGILGALALPAYSRYVLRSQRIEAKTLLNLIAQRQERFFSTYNVYTANLTAGGSAGLGMTANCGAAIGSENCLYIADVETRNAGLQYSITATPEARQSSDVCQVLTLFGTGEKTYSGAATNGACW